jgi:hypothetical protein
MIITTLLLEISRRMEIKICARINTEIFFIIYADR